MTLNLVHLATLREFARRGSLAAAAEALGYTPGAASLHLSGLEKELGTPIVVKAGRNVELTDAGRVLLEHAEVLLADEERARRAVGGAGDDPAGRVVVGIWGSSAAAFLGPVVAEAASHHPRLELTSREVPVDIASRSVRTREVDLAFGLDYPDDPIPRDRGTHVIPLLEERFWVAAAGSGRRRRPASLADLADRPWILPSPTTVMGRALLVGFRRAGVEPDVVHEVNDSAASLALASQGLGLTLATDLMQRLAAAPRTDRIPLRDDLVRRLVLVTPADLSGRRAVEAVAAVAADVVRSSPGGIPA